MHYHVAYRTPQLRFFRRFWLITDTLETEVYYRFRNMLGRELIVPKLGTVFLFSRKWG